jgi:beta-carotene hydroxylase
MSALPDLRALGLDLIRTRRSEAAWVLARPFIFAALFFIATAVGAWPLAPLCIFFLFVSIVASAHDVVHGSLGLSRRAAELWLFALGALVLESGHAYRLTHLRHHAVFPGPDDPEGEPAKHSFWAALAMGPTYIPRLWLWALHRANARERRWLIAEAAWALAAVAGALAATRFTPWPLVYVLTVIVASWVYPVSTAHLPHKNYGVTELTQTHTLRGRIVPALFFELTYHLEHHLYPGVPTHRLVELSHRLEPHLRAAGVVLTRVP